MSDEDGTPAIMGLIQASGLRLSDAELRELATLYAHFAPARAALTDVDLGGIEPMMIVRLGLEEQRHDNG